MGMSGGERVYLCSSEVRGGLQVCSSLSLRSFEGLSLNLELANLRDPSAYIPSVLRLQAFVGPFLAFHMGAGIRTPGL